MTSLPRRGGPCVCVLGAAMRAHLVMALASTALRRGAGCEAFQTLRAPSRDGLAAATPDSLLPASRSRYSLFLEASSAQNLRGEPPVGRSSTAVCSLPRSTGDKVRDTATRLVGNRGLTQRTVRLREAAAASGDRIGGSGSSHLSRSSKAARVTVRRAKEGDYQGVAGIREVIIPVGMSGATGFMGGKVVLDSPAEAEKRLLMSKVADLVSGEAVALIALENRRIVGTVDCIIQPAAAAAASMPLQPQKQPDNLGGGARSTRTTKTAQVFLKNLFVLPEERRRGIARELVKGAEVFARKENAGTICLDVARKNAAARELYLGCGFEEAERPGPVEGGMGGALLKSLGMGKRYMVKRV